VRAWLILALVMSSPAHAGDEKDKARLLLRQFGCGSCHRIPEVADAVGDVGPSLEKFGARSYIAGILPNNTDNLVRFIRDPRSVDSRTAMPNLGVGEAHARAMAAYLRSLR